jgi:hypothetical protein
MITAPLLQLRSLPVPSWMDIPGSGREIECWISQLSPATPLSETEVACAEWVKNEPQMKRAGVYLWLRPLRNGRYQYFHVGKAKNSVGTRTRQHVRHAHQVDMVPVFETCQGSGEFVRMSVLCLLATRWTASL